jgi:hypothetical protein
MSLLLHFTHCLRSYCNKTFKNIFPSPLCTVPSSFFLPIVYSGFLKFPSHCTVYISYYNFPSHSVQWLRQFSFTLCTVVPSIFLHIVYSGSLNFPSHCVQWFPQFSFPIANSGFLNFPSPLCTVVSSILLPHCVQ